MGLKDKISTLRDGMWYMSDSKLEKIKKSLEQFEGDFWSHLISELTAAECAYQETFDIVHRTALEKIYSKFCESYIRHDGYVAILNDPKSYDAVIEKVKLDIQNIPVEVKKYFDKLDMEMEQIEIKEGCS